MRGVVAAGHPLTAEAGAEALRAGGNAVDAAVAAGLMSFVCESPLSGPGAGGFMFVHTASGENHLLDFFVAAPGRGLDKLEPVALLPVDIKFAEGAVQRFNVGPSSCGAYGTPAGLAEALERFGTLPLADLVERPARAAREGIEVNEVAAFIHVLLEAIFRTTPEATAIYAPNGSLLRAGETIRLPEVGDLLERLGREGPAFLYTGDVGAAVSDWLLERGGLLTHADLAAYEVIEREPARVEYRGRDVLTNPQPSYGGILMAYSLDLLGRLDASGRLRTLVEVMDRTNRARREEINVGLHTQGYLEGFLAKEALESAARELGSRLGSTTHLSTIDEEGACVSMTCSNGSCSGVVVPGTGVHLNNMMGEEDLNPAGYHLHPPGARVPSMMAPTVVLRNGVAEVALGSAGSNRIPAAILQTILGVVDQGLTAEAAVRAPRLLVEERTVKAEPGLDSPELDAYGMAATLDFALEAKQDLLELRSESERLERLAGLFETAIEQLDHAEMAAERARGNGKVRFEA